MALQSVVLDVCFSKRLHTYKFNMGSEWHVFEKLFHGKFIFCQSFCSEKIAEEIIFSYIVLMADLGYEPGSLISQHATH